MHKQIKIVVVGLGRIGMFHCAQVSAHPGCLLAGIADSKKHLEPHVKSFGITSPFFTDSSAALAQIQPHGVIISTPQFAHLVTSQAFLEAKIPVLIEKPLAHCLSDAQAIAHKAQAAVAVGFMKAHDPLMVMAEDLMAHQPLGVVAQSKITVSFGQVLQPQQSWNYEPSLSGGGVLINAGIHALGQILRLLGSVTSVKAKTRKIHSLKVEDEMTASLKFKSGASAQFVCNWSVPGYNTLHTHILIEGNNGFLCLTDDQLSFNLKNSVGIIPAGKSTIWKSQLANAAFNLSPDYAGDAYWFQLENFCRTITEGTAPRVNLQEGLAIQTLVDALYRSANSEESVQL